jgi:hypothetical protein
MDPTTFFLSLQMSEEIPERSIDIWVAFSLVK